MTKPERGGFTVMKRPEWWDWESRLSAHLLDRMLDRVFSEVDLRLMIENATAVHGSGSHSRWSCKRRTTHDDGK